MPTSIKKIAKFLVPKRMHPRIRQFLQRMVGARSPLHPTRWTARGVKEEIWRRSQVELELSHWLHGFPGEVPSGKSPEEYYREHYWPLNGAMFRTIEAADYTDKVVVDVGCGPFGSLDVRGAKLWIGVDSLAADYGEHYGFEQYHLFVSALAESIPLLDEVADVVVSINALDHFRDPYKSLEEMYRICKRGGRVWLATDVGGTPHHPCNINPRHLDDFIRAKNFDVLERDCGTHIPSSWPTNLQIPLYVFHGLKRS